MKKIVNLEVLGQTKETNKTFFAVKAMVDDQVFEGYAYVNSLGVWFVSVGRACFSLSVDLSPQTFFALVAEALENSWNEDTFVHHAILAKAAATAEKAEEVHA